VLLCGETIGHPT
jgi:DNA-binding winged helix-turn-helix (wHTH) protein